MKKVSIITVNFNQPKVTTEFLSSVALSGDHPHEIIVVDNGSYTDQTEELRIKFPDAVYIRSDENLGFAGGNNIGIKKSSGDYLFFVNNDTEYTTGLIFKLKLILDNNPDVGAVSPKILYFNNPEIIQYAGFTPMNFNTGRNKCLGQFEKDFGQYDSNTGPTAYAHGAAMMVRREAIERAGVMPENYFLYYEEMDWCEQIKRSGFQIWIEPKAQIYHKESMSVGVKSPLKEYFMTRNRILFIRRNGSFLNNLLFGIYFSIIVVPKSILKYIILLRVDLAMEFLKAIRWNILNGKNR